MTASPSATHRPAAGQPVVLTRVDGDRVTVLRHGAHVTAWQAGGVERLYLSPTSGYGDGAAIRGGIPVVFPQFNQRGPDTTLPKHGFARNHVWDVVGQAADRVTLRLTDDPVTRALWPHAFRLELTVILGERRLTVELAATNTGTADFAFTAALHSYFAVGDIAATRVTGLAGVRMLDTVVPGPGGGRTGLGDAAPLAFAGETDRIYWQAGAPIGLQCPIGPLTITMQGFEDAVVWNPWAARAATLPDLPDDDWRRMLCIEAARIGRPVTLAPGAVWHGSQTCVVAG